MPKEMCVMSVNSSWPAGVVHTSCPMSRSVPWPACKVSRHWWRLASERGGPLIYLEGKDNRTCAFISISHALRSTFPDEMLDKKRKTFTVTASFWSKYTVNIPRKKHRRGGSGVCGVNDLRWRRTNAQETWIQKCPKISGVTWLLYTRNKNKQMQELAEEWEWEWGGCGWEKQSQTGSSPADGCWAWGSASEAYFGSNFPENALESFIRGVWETAKRCHIGEKQQQQQQQSFCGLSSAATVCFLAL